jgi:hypothetical protein
MLMRRLKSGKLAPVSISPLLTDAQKVGLVVLIPNQSDGPNSVAMLIAQTLLQHQFQLALFQGLLFWEIAFLETRNHAITLLPIR